MKYKVISRTIFHPSWQQIRLFDAYFVSCYAIIFPFINIQIESLKTRKDTWLLPQNNKPED